MALLGRAAAPAAGLTAVLEVEEPRAGFCGFDPERSDVAAACSQSERRGRCPDFAEARLPSFSRRPTAAAPCLHREHPGAGRIESDGW